MFFWISSPLHQDSRHSLAWISQCCYGRRAAKGSSASFCFCTDGVDGVPPVYLIAASVEREKEARRRSTLALSLHIFWRAGSSWLVTMATLPPSLLKQKATEGASDGSRRRGESPFLELSLLFFCYLTHLMSQMIWFDVVLCVCACVSVSLFLSLQLLNIQCVSYTSGLICF